MKKAALLNSSISAVIAEMGHTDTLVIADCGLPIPEGPERIDLALTRGIPSFEQVLDAVLTELHVEKVTIASGTRERNPEFYQLIQARFPTVPIEEIPHTELKARSKTAKAIIRSGENKPLSNIILQSGVFF